MMLISVPSMLPMRERPVRMAETHKLSLNMVVSSIAFRPSMTEVKLEASQPTVVRLSMMRKVKIFLSKAEEARLLLMVPIHGMDVPICLKT